MPTYDYECTKCERRFELFQSISARPVRKIETDCADCSNKAPVKRLIGTGSAVLFKGSGFYQTDYRSDSYKKAAKKETESTSPKDSKDKKSKGDSPAKKESGSESGGGESSSAGKSAKDD